MADRTHPKGCRCGACYYAKYSGMKDWTRHPDLGKRVRTKHAVEFGAGVVPAGTTAPVLRVEPAASGNTYIVQLPGTTGQDGERGFDKYQLEFLP